jgi:hypothetical protein
LDRLQQPRVLWGLVATLLLAHCALAWASRMPGVLTGEDEAIYLLLAQQIPQLRYHDVFLAHQPFHAMYPPGYPVLLALWSGIAGTGFDGFLLPGITASAGALLLTFLVVRKLWSVEVALLILAALAVNPYLVDRAGTLASEAPFTLLTLLALWGVVQGGRAGLAVAASAAVGAALTRSLGITVCLALAANWLWGRRFAPVAALGGAAVATAGAWLVWTALAPGKLVGASYAADFTQAGVGGGPALLPFIGVLGTRIAANVPAYLGITVPSLLPLPALPRNPVDNLLGAGLTALGLLAGLLVLWRRWRVAALYLVATAIILAIWPWHVERFIMPLLPLLVSAVVIGAGDLAARRRPAWRVPAMAGLAAVLILTGAAQSAAAVSSAARCERGQHPPAPSCVSPDQSSYFAALDFVRTSLPEDAVLLSTKRATAYYYSGRRQIAWQTAFAAGPDGLVDLLRSRGVEHVILASLHWADLGQLPAVLEPNCGAFTLVRHFPPRTYLLRLRSPEEPDDGSGCAAVAEHRARNVSRDFERER